MTIEINLATYDKQNEILRKLNEGGEGYFYLLASFDSEASQSDIESLKGLDHINNIKQSEVAKRAFNGSGLCMNAVGGKI